MARISMLICDMCKEPLEEQGGLTKLALSFLEIHTEPVEAEICDYCTKDILDRLKSESVAPEPHKKHIKKTRQREVISHDDDPENAPAVPTIASMRSRKAAVRLANDLRQGSVQKKTKPKRRRADDPNAWVELEPTEDLLDHELHVIPSSVDLREGSKDLRKLNKLVTKGGCKHHFKSWSDEFNGVICADAPSGMQGELAHFRGCGKRLQKDEL